MIATVSNKKNAVRVNRFIHVPPWVRMKTTSVPGGAMRPPSVARPSSAALDPWLCGPVLRRGRPYRGGRSFRRKLGAGEGASSGAPPALRPQNRELWGLFDHRDFLSAARRDRWVLFCD